jgi:hypothetical protein
LIGGLHAPPHWGKPGNLAITNGFNCAVYFGGLNEMFFNPRQEHTFLDLIVGTVSVFLFPFIIYFCIFSFMVSTLPPTLPLKTFEVTVLIS